MAKYLFRGKYTPEGVKGVMRDGGSGRSSAVQEGLASVGGSLSAMYFSVGGNEVFVIGELPDSTAATLVGAATFSSGAFTAAEAIPLVTPEELDEALSRLSGVTYRPPGS